MNVTFERWCQNHPETHKARWCRELYPWRLFDALEYRDTALNKKQIVTFDSADYEAVLRDKTRQSNGRIRYTIDLSTHPRSRAGSWTVRAWNTTFVLIASPEDDFITLYTKKEDPSLTLVADFMAGKFERVAESRSLPVAAMLGRHLVSYLCAEAFGALDHYATYPILKDGLRQLPRHGQFPARGEAFQPMWSRGRALWIAYCFFEDKAHRLAFVAADQCEALRVLYCNPVLSRHHRCSWPGVEVSSLHQLLAELPASTQHKYETHIRVLQNHLHIFEPSAQMTSEQLCELIDSGRAISEPVKLSYGREALAVLKMEVRDAYDLAYVLAASNLLNAWINQSRKADDKRVPKGAFSFKTYTANALRDAIAKGFPEPEICCEEDLTYIRLFGVQFSFHNLPLRDVMVGLASANRHRSQEWSGVRLQPIANTVLDWARQKRRERI